MEFEHILKKYRLIVDKELGKFFDEKIKETADDFLKLSYTYLKEFVLRQGKRVRPIATIMAYKAIKEEDEEKIYPVSIAPELFHASSLVHDDIMDEDLLRRNRPTMHVIFEDYFQKEFAEKNYSGHLFSSSSKRFSASIAIIQGNLLYSLATSSILESKLDEKAKNKSISICNSAYLKTNEGQIFDILLSCKEEPIESQYDKMILNKTASPISASIILGAMLNHASSMQLKYLGMYGINIGLAFQIHDDIMDVSKNMLKGREIASDIKKGNKTIIIIKALENCSKSQRDYILKVLGNENASDAEIERVIDIINKTKAVEYSSRWAEKIILQAKNYLKKARLNKNGSDFFENFADYTIKRKE